jgi:hypothetical protein
VEHEIEREFIWIKCIEWNKMLHLNNTCVYAQYTCRLVWNKNYMLSEISVKVFRSSRKLVGPAETDIV